MVCVVLFAADDAAATLRTLQQGMQHAVLDWPLRLICSERQHLALLAIPEAAALFSLPGVDVLTGEQVLDAASLGQWGDIVWLDAGVHLPLGWDARLQAAARAEPACASISPLCSGFPMYEPRFAAQFAGTDLAMRDRLCVNESSGMVDATPTSLPVCAYLRSSCLLGAKDTRDLRTTEARSALGWALSAQGACHGLCDWLLVEWGGKAVRTNVPEHLQPRVSSYLQASSLAHRRFGTSALPAGLMDGRLVQLHVMHSWGGGLERWVQDYSAASTGRQNLVLKSIGSVGLYGQRLALFLDISHAEPIQVWDFADGIRGTAHHHIEYARALREIVETYMVDAVVVSSLIGHSLDVLATGLPTLHVLHEFHPYCPALYIHFGSVCGSCNATRLARCHQENPVNHLFRSILPEEWLALRAAYFQQVKENKVKLVAPSQSVINHYQQLVPDFHTLEPVVITHGMAWESQPPKAREPGRRLRLVVLGALTEHKGLHLFEGVLEQVKDSCEFILLGCGESGARFGGHPAVTVIPRYDRDKLPALLAELAPDAGVLMSIWPETFSYTLSELLCAGIPAVAPSHGAYPDRIRDGENGFLCTPVAEHFVAVLHRLHADRSLLLHARQALAGQAHRSCADMVADYDRLLPGRPMQGGFYPQRRAYSLEGISLASHGFPLSMRQALFNAHGFLRGKVANTPRLRRWQRRLLGGSLEFTMRVIYRVWRLVGKERW
ncbi:Glycosyltransferase involved in cell wall bisynthesis [Andreprevotia lacus DSM 23236]|jgi:glycosyltransferase involved in cell wall biosynthesis|uniref:Glycosyltransferase involved in cell wall bisynthesis n=1 Tax=Andreprevotia lacus DSM 23236 TaxID=1121001 RepID=A0A1W1XYG4_9NEIS|nr:glycosyltransferase [Andreprevotia lacus]SMC28963.1 Glycosyltransferase involved in cell wall bisynthesis [Andreprevotia lacus DSM 23236]